VYLHSRILREKKTMNFSYGRDGCLEEIAYPVLWFTAIYTAFNSIHLDVYV